MRATEIAPTPTHLTSPIFPGDETERVLAPLRLNITQLGLDLELLVSTLCDFFNVFFELQDLTVENILEF